MKYIRNQSPFINRNRKPHRLITERDETGRTIEEREASLADMIRHVIVNAPAVMRGLTMEEMRTANTIVDICEGLSDGINKEYIALEDAQYNFIKKVMENTSVIILGLNAPILADRLADLLNEDEIKKIQAARQPETEMPAAEVKPA